MTVLEIGPGMGYFSLPLARLVGKEGRVLCVDVQEKMLQGLKRRAEKAKLLERIVIVRASDDSLHLEGYRSAVDFTLAFAVVHEVRDQAWLLEQINQAMKPGSLLLISEPRGHVNDQEFERTVAVARAKGYDLVERLRIRRSNSVVMKKSNVPHSASGPQSM
jgi:predicted O-methyltransferase YrrM